MGDAAADRRTRWLTIAWGVTLLVLIGVTLPLWTPRGETQAGPPRLPATRFDTPAPFDWLLLGVTAVAVAIATLSAARNRVKMTAVATGTVALAGLLLGDQLRWQPWAWHAVVAGLLLAGRPPCDAVRRLRWLAIAVYGFSALAKLDATFAATLGQQLLLGAGEALGVAVSDWSEATRTRLALALPAGELLVAVLLAISLRVPAIAKPACLAAIAMHAATIALLSPASLGHSLGVLLWNVGFAAQTTLLFWPSEFAPRVESTANGVARVRWLARPARWVAWVATLAPVLTPLGWWDAWPGWALYAPGTERAAVLVHSAAADRLPDGLADYLDDATTEGPWRRVRVDRWVLDRTGAPLYPANRVTAALAASIADEAWLDDRLLVVWESAADRFTGTRRAATLRSTDAIREAASPLHRISFDNE